MAAMLVFIGPMIGIPPQTLASNIKSQLCSCANGNNSEPNLAKTSLLAVTTCLPLAKALAINSLAGCSRPSSSTIISISLSSSTSSALSVKIYLSPYSCFRRSTWRSSTLVILTGLPTSLAIFSAFFSKTFSTPPPTVPAPNRPTFTKSFIVVPLQYLNQ